MKKALISILLLLTYSLGFAHNLIPHNHSSEQEKQIIHKDKSGHHHHHKGKHKAVKHTHTDHSHISHGNHYDEDLYDLLVCFLHKTDQQKNDCKEHHYLPTKRNQVVTNNIQKVKLVATLTALFTETEQTEFVPDQATDSEIIHTSPPLENSPHRGPPSFS